MGCVGREEWWEGEWDGRIAWLDGWLVGGLGNCVYIRSVAREEYICSCH